MTQDNMTPGNINWAKRITDLLAALVLGTVFLPFLAGLVLIMAFGEGRPFFYVSERMRAPGRPFHLWKLRSMRPELPGNNTGVSGGDKSGRVTPFGRWLRKTRLDELPQLLNVLRGDMSLVGPRPPLRHYVEAYPEIYAEVLKNRPGITGLATVIFHGHEEYLLRDCRTPTETEAVYTRRCIARKARLDLIYQKHAGPGLDLWILYLTLARLLPLPGRRAARLRRKRHGFRKY